MPVAGNIYMLCGPALQTVNCNVYCCTRIKWIHCTCYVYVAGRSTSNCVVPCRAQYTPNTHPTLCMQLILLLWTTPSAGHCPWRRCTAAQRCGLTNFANSGLPDSLGLPEHTIGMLRLYWQGLSSQHHPLVDNSTVTPRYMTACHPAGALYKLHACSLHTWWLRGRIFVIESILVVLSPSLLTF